MSVAGAQVDKPLSKTCTIKPQTTVLTDVKYWWFNMWGTATIGQMVCDKNYNKLKRFWPSFQHSFDKYSQDVFTLHTLVNYDEAASGFENDNCGLHLQALEEAYTKVSTVNINSMLMNLKRFSYCASEMNNEMIESDVPDSTLADLQKMRENSFDVMIKLCSFQTYLLPEYKKYINKSLEACKILVATRIMLPVEDLESRMTRIKEEFKELSVQLVEIQKKITSYVSSSETNVLEWTETMNIIEQIIAYSKPAGTLIFAINKALITAEVNSQRVEEYGEPDNLALIKTDMEGLIKLKTAIKKAYADANEVKRILRQQKYTHYSFERRTDPFHNIVESMTEVVGKLNQTVRDLKTGPKETIAVP
ncbi:MAG: hypothetical protein KAI17_06445 [Thiotrichaceae bacterium]|nr:hypothetical protein [Thiotrichaceae bacterium]